MSYIDRAKKRLPQSVSKVSNPPFDTFESGQGRHFSENRTDTESMATYQAMATLFARSALGILSPGECIRRFEAIEHAYQHGDARSLRRAIAKALGDEYQQRRKAS
ncbi:MAG: hypothetical protein GY835_01455 [bacterium]|nr:hypothetical protein [bacterium]